MEFELPEANEDTMVRTAAAHLTRRFAGLDESRVTATVKRHVHERCAHARITTFVGILAERGAREELDAAGD